jgi:protein-disulfide isomerase
MIAKQLRHGAIAAALVWATLILGGVPALAQSAGDPIDPAERDRVESIVRDYLLRNPEIIMEAIQVLETRERAAAEAARADMMNQLVPTLRASPLTPIFGAENGDVVMVEFFDYQCGYCKRLFPGVQDVMKDDPNLTVVFVEYPVLGPASLVAARAALASHKQGLYMEYHAALMEHAGRLTDDVVFARADDVGLDVDLLKADMDAPEIMTYLRMVREIAEALGIRGTPSMVIGDQFIGGFVPPDRLRDAVEAARGEG